MPFTIVTQGTFTQPATAVNQIIPLPSGVDYFVTTNLTQMATTQGTGRVVRGEWFGGGLTAVNDGLRWKKTNSTSAINIDNFSTSTASNGFTYVTSFPAPQAALTGTTITQANGAVASVTNTYSEGDTVVIYNAVGMQQISGMTFTISSVSGSAFTLVGLDSSGFAAGATAFSVRRVNQFTPVEPSFLYVTAITQAAQAQVTVSQANSVYLGQKLEFTIPGSFGMVQLNNYYQTQNLPAVVTSIVDAYNFTINVNTTNFTAFAFPASSGSPTTQLFATVAPAGQSTQFNPITGVQTGYNFLQIPFHSGVFVPYMYVSAGAQSPGGSASDVIIWQAYKMETGTINAPVPS
jgi:hypothetical protein